VRDTFYTWTSPEQIAELRSGQNLLSRSKSKDNKLSHFDLAIRDPAFSKSPITALLQDTLFTNKRFAWTNAWATVMGWDNEKYGDQLLQIVLDPRSIVGMFNENDKVHPYRFYYLNGQGVDEKTVLRSKNKLAALYHVSERSVKKPQRCNQGYTSSRIGKRTQVPFREFVILNESMVKSWSYASPSVLSKIDSEIQLLKLASAEVDRSYPLGRRKIKYQMRSEIEFSLFETYQSDVDWFFWATCFENDYYIKNKKCIDRIIRKLEKARAAQGASILK
jgi:hypothetical protein